MKSLLICSLLSASLLLADQTKLAGASATAEKAAPEKPAPEEEWVSLFDGDTLAGWCNKDGQPVTEGKWTAEDGVLSRATKGAGDLYSAKMYGDFELAFDWKIETGSNSGVKYRVQKINGKMLGLEYQILDDQNHPDNKDRDHQTAALYDLKSTIEGKPMKTVGEWNSSRIVVSKGLVQHFLNGTLVVEIQIPSQEWTQRFAKSKYKASEGFGLNEKGYLMLQDHRDPVSFRYLKIRKL